MNITDDDVRVALLRAVEGKQLNPPSVQALMRAHRRRMLRRRSATAASAVAVGVVSTVALYGAVGGDQSEPLPVGPAASGTGGPVVCQPGSGPIAKRDPELAAVCLPDPAPGFPLRRLPDTMAETDFKPPAPSPTRTFLLGTTPPIVHKLSSGDVEETPTGQEATVMVARAGAFPTTPIGLRADGFGTVIGTTTVRGVTAVIVRNGDDPNSIGVIVAVGGFDVAAYGSSDATPDQPVTVQQLATLIDSLQHLRSPSQ